MSSLWKECCPIRNHNLDAEGKKAAAANGARPVAKKRRQRRRWSAEEKVRIARESFASSESVTAMAARHGIGRNRLSAWRSQLRRGKLVAPASSASGPEGGFATVEVEAAHSAAIEGRGVMVRLQGVTDTSGIAAIAVALAGAS